MVFYKRAPVTFVSDPNIRDENTAVWMIKATGEIFTEYDKYATRLDFYRKKQFTNQITGQGNLSFFDALEAEDEDAREIRSIFPGPLRYQVCRKVHHSTIPRLEELVTRVHADLKDDYYPGEHVIAQIDENVDKRVPGIIRDKITFSPSVDVRNHPTLNQPPLSRYFVTVQNEDSSNDMLLDNLLIQPKRNGLQRPALKFLSDDVPPRAEPPADKLGIQMKSVGDLLFVWQTLNVHAEVFILDSFTIDDFIEALSYHGDAVNCELLVEVHCAVLKQLVDEKGHIMAALNPRRKEVCEKILAHLVPSELDPDPETVALQYNTLDINLRIAALGIITQYATFTDAVRTYMQNCNINMTSIRNQKMEQQKKRKEYQAELGQLEQKRKMDYPATLSVSPPAETNGDVSMSGVTEPDTNAEQDAAEDEEGARRLRRANSRKRKHEDEATRKERERKEKEEAERAKQRNAYRELLKKIDKTNEAIKTCEAEIKKFDEELRENQCQQLRCLGKDRFCNTYWWLERWGMPLGGLPTSSTAEYGYVNGRLWVQGPDELDQPLLEHETPEDEKEYKALTGLTMNERRDQEEGPVHLTDSTQWGFIDNPEDVQKIHEWLDDRGHRELKLKKELSNWQDSIIEYMVNWKNHLSEVQAQKTAGEDTTGIQTRKKTYTDNDSSKYWCLKWENSYALDELEHLHSQQPPPKTKAKNSRSKKGGR
ncbi:putative ddt domain protein [Neofusicoccum parvum UCRNP2]|uniref:Putative ddt domain protein n=1 Tax=Botryosphaeria parva (strain UCR-NP2) TaxID=1287680 RepID=R1ER28_BOTPV|nr:putative ddt domain protein [Neofusicoccum parvum UCRNP2]